jgi:uncharacterized protein (DUF58 family)
MGGWAWAVVFDLAILLLCLLDYVMALRDGEIHLRRRFPMRLSQGSGQQVEIIVRHTGIRPKVLQIRDHTPLTWDGAPVLRLRIRGRSDRTLSYEVFPPARGTVMFGDLFLRVRGPLGLLLRTSRYPATREVKVYPSLAPLQYQDLATYRRTSRQWGIRTASWRGEGREFESLREYIEGDDPRKIHWKASARQDRPIVQEYQPEKNQIVMVLLDMGRLMGSFTSGKSKLDHAMEATVQLGHAALAGGDQVGVLAFSDRVVSFVPPNRTPEQLQLILDHTLGLEPSMVESHYEDAFLWFRSKVRRRSLVVIFTDIVDETGSENLLDAVALLKPSHLPLCVAIGDTEWEDLLKAQPDRLQEVYEKSVMQESFWQRRRALMGLVRKGALALDLPPTRLGIGTLQHYLQVKRRGLL